MADIYERFTDRARRTVVLAQEECRLLNHRYIGTEHLLLALIHEGDGVAASVLKLMTASDDPETPTLLEAARVLVEARIGRGSTSTSGHILFTPRCRLIHELALREALGLGHNWIGTEHLLLGLVREGEGVGATVLTADLGLNLDEIRNQVLETLKGYKIHDVAPAPGFESDLLAALMADGCVDGLRVATLRAIVAVAGKVHDASAQG